MGKLKNAIIVTLAFVEMFFFSGVFYGYNSLVPIYKDANVFSQYCNHSMNSTYNSCASQDVYFGRAFVTWLIVQALMSFVLGLIFDKFGLRITKLIASVCLLGGFICLGFTPKINFLLFLGGSLLTISAHSLGISSISLSVLFKNKSNMIVSLFSALFDASAFTMSGIRYITNFGIPFWLICIVYGSTGAFIILGSIILLKPRAADLLSKKHNPSKMTKTENKKCKHLNENQTCKEKKNNYINISSVKELYQLSVQQSFPSIFKCVQSSVYIIHVLVFIILCFRFTFFLAQMPLQLDYLFPNQLTLIDHLLSISNIFFLGSLLISPVFGIFLDKYQTYTFKMLSVDSNLSPQYLYNRINACFIVPCLICSTAMIAASSLILVPNKYCIYLAFACVTITRSLLFSINGSYLISAFPNKYFGTLIGIIFFIAGLINLLQQIFIKFATPDMNPNILNKILLGICALTLAHGLFLKFKK